MSFTTNEYLNQVRKKLVSALGEKRESYFLHMKQWFRMRITKEEFDATARSFLPSDSVHLHNEFLLAILNKCQLFSSTSVSSSVTVKLENTKLEERTDPSVMTSSHCGSMNSNLFNIGSNERKVPKPKKRVRAPSIACESVVKAVRLSDVAPSGAIRDPVVLSETGAGYQSRTLHMLGAGPLKGRLLLAAWDVGLSGVDEEVSLLLHEAVKQCIKNVLSAVISRRKGFRLRENKFLHSIGTVPPNPWLRNAASLLDWSSESLGMPLGEAESARRPAWPTVEAAEQNAAQLASCGPAFEPPLQPLSAYDLFITLQVDKSVIPCHSVYAVNMERISSRLWQPSWSDLEQEAIYLKEQSLKDSLRGQRQANTSVT